jgi:hypothetical protein
MYGRDLSMKSLYEHQIYFSWLIYHFCIEISFKTQSARTNIILDVTFFVFYLDLFSVR